MRNRFEAGVHGVVEWARLVGGQDGVNLGGQNIFLLLERRANRLDFCKSSVAKSADCRCRTLERCTFQAPFPELNRLPED